MKKLKVGTLVCDANILIDYFDNNKHVLKLATAHCYEIYVPTQIFNEVEQMNEQDAKRLGIKLIEPTLPQLTEAVSISGNSALSGEDCLCLIIARDKKWICATNEKRLYNECKKQKVNVIRGLRIMLELNHQQKLDSKDATDTAEKIKDSNPRLTEAVLKKFISLLK